MGVRQSAPCILSRPRNCEADIIPSVVHLSVLHTVDSIVAEQQVLYTNRITGEIFVWIASSQKRGFELVKRSHLQEWRNTPSSFNTE